MARYRLTQAAGSFLLIAQLDASRGLLVVIDGAKALASAVRQVFGDLALIQRCTLHKRRNVADHLPEAERARVDAKLARVQRPGRGATRRPPSGWPPAAGAPGAAASLREGLEEMFAVRRPGIDG